VQIEETLECHECSIVCEKVVYPSECLGGNCRYVYAFNDHGRAYFGCIEKVFVHEIDLEAFREIERTKGGFGVVKAVRQPLESCAVAVQSCYQCVDSPLCRNLYFRKRDRREIEPVGEG
jgi:hypothetical protein